MQFTFLSFFLLSFLSFVLFIFIFELFNVTEKKMYTTHDFVGIISNLPLRRNSWCFYFLYSVKGMVIECASRCLDDPLYTTPRKVKIYSIRSLFSYSTKNIHWRGDEEAFFVFLIVVVVVHRYNI